MQVLFQVPEVKILRGRWNFVLQKCKGKRVLHLGCVDEGVLEERFAEGKLMHQELSRITKEVWGVDISESGITFLKSKGITNLFVGNVEKINELTELYSKKFDIIVASEIIEHLDNPGLFMVHPFIHPISRHNVRQQARLLLELLERWNRRRREKPSNQPRRQPSNGAHPEPG